jgi:hypothetical protein
MFTFDVSLLMFVGFAFQGKNIEMHRERTKVWYPYILGSCGIHNKNIYCLIEGFIGASKTTMC